MLTSLVDRIMFATLVSKAGYRVKKLVIITFYLIIDNVTEAFCIHPQAFLS